MSSVDMENDDSESDSHALRRTLSHDTRRRPPKYVSFGTEQSVTIVEEDEEEEEEEEDTKALK